METTFISFTNLLLSMLDVSLLTWIPVLIILGILYKQCFNFNKRLLPIAVIISAFCIAIIQGIVKGKTGSVLDFIGYCAGQGILLSAIAIMLYDTVKNLYKYVKEKISPEENKEVN